MGYFITLCSVLLIHSTYFPHHSSEGGAETCFIIGDLNADVRITVLPTKKGVLHGFSVGCSRDPEQILAGRLLFTSPCVLRHKRKVSKKLMELGLEAL